MSCTVSLLRPQRRFHLPVLAGLLLLLGSSSSRSMGLNQDGILLLSFKYSVLSDPFSVLAGWNYDDETPCSWNGVMCMGFPADAGGNNGSAWNWEPNTNVTVSRVISLVLPGAKLLGPISSDLGLIEHLRHLDLSSNVLNGSLPPALFNASELRHLSLADNEISGELPASFGELRNLQILNLSDNALMGSLPKNLTLLPNLTVVSLSNNYLSGELPGGGFKKLEVLDLSSNLVNGSIPTDLLGENLRYLNLSYNRLAGEIPPELGLRIPANSTVDFSFNNLTGEIPQSKAFLEQKEAAFAGNQDLCGQPLKNLCTIPSTLSNPPNDSTTAAKSPPAFAAIPKTPQGDSRATDAGGGEGSQSSAGLKPAMIAAITIGDLAGVGLLFIVFLYVYQTKKKKQQQQHRERKGMGATKQDLGMINERPLPQASPEPRGLGGFSWCLGKKSGDGEDDTEETSDSTASSEAETEEDRERNDGGGKSNTQPKPQGGILVAVDDETELELDTLLKASAYILGASGATIVYKAVLAGGTTFAVRRIGESTSSDKLKDFETQVRAIAKLRHHNVLPVRGFYWGADEKLLIHDYATNGSLANISFNSISSDTFIAEKLGSSPFHLSWDSRLRIARGVARGLAFLHEKKCVHGNLKPSNILLTADMEPMIGDLGLDRLLSGASADHKPGASARQFGSKRSTLSQGSLPEFSPVAGASPIGAASSSSSCLSPHPYQAPESLKNLKPNAKWDVFSFGVVLLELMAGRVFLEVELIQWNAGFIVEEKNRLLRMADAAIRGEVEGKEEALLSCFKLGFSCASMAPQRRPSMKEAAQLLDRLVFSSESSS
ncbi:putative LRR receptor-like serine/threonine-protein kinase [Apostasia shenzhenica]|uniref:Putative LRR receptor-like serine/threonine-protein kinase n=1 Tax=Apostasia shenzhenica TaxID=1088818 RepID=A0A2I0B6Y7_9ASPA|nr:putative LRR receptor-like serine/threonine-protein kinase [Apostasia shenzhenica]